MKNIGFVGFGLIGRKRKEACDKLGHNTSFIADPKIEKEDDCIFKSVNELPIETLNNTDHIIIALPHNLIKDTFKYLSNYCSSFLIEKPLGLNIAEGNEINKIANEKNIEVATGFNYRFLHNIKKLKELIDQNYFGEIYSIDMTMAHGGRPGMEKEWKLNKRSAGGGVVIDPGIHLFDLMNYLIPLDTNIEYCDLSNLFWESDVEDSFYGIFNKQKIKVRISVDILSWQNLFNIKIVAKSGYAFLSGRGGNYGDLKIDYCKRWFWENNSKIESKNYGNIDESFFDETKCYLENYDDNNLSKIEDSLKSLSIVSDIYSKY
mgnify:CR=1 FL=1